MLHFRPAAYSLNWYRDTLANPQWTLAIKNSLIIGCAATLPATALGTLAALGLSQRVMPWRSQIMAVLISPMIVPVIITASGLYFFYSDVGLTQSLVGIILAHIVLGSPFVVLTVTATLAGFDRNLTRAASSLGADPLTSFLKVTMPLILPGILSGAVFAFITSFDEVVVVLFLAGYDQRTIPRQMWAGIRDQISPTILAVATILIAVSIVFMGILELLRRRSRRLHRVTAAT
ncbi:MAG: ABC transporter permease, partial [Alphaproteobacteria bacterium]|nr:ABC transporter permease [Alphaproteobacteria bacterium]